MDAKISGIVCSVVTVVTLAACSGDGSHSGGATPTSPVSGASGASGASPVASHLATFSGSVDVQKGTIDFTYDVTATAAATPDGLHAESLPYGTSANHVYFHTSGSTAYSGHKLTGSVLAENLYGSSVTNLTAVVTSISVTGVTANLPGPAIPTAPATGSPFLNYGTVAANSASAAQTWTFTDPGDQNFNFIGYADGTVAGGPTNTINVLSATYGGNCAGVTAGNDTTKVGAVCNGTSSPCVYPAGGIGIYPAFGSDPASGCYKNFTASWTCNGGSVQTLTVCNTTPDTNCEAGFTNATLTCP